MGNEVVVEVVYDSLASEDEHLFHLEEGEGLPEGIQLLLREGEPQDGAGIGLQQHLKVVDELVPVGLEENGVVRWVYTHLYYQIASSVHPSQSVHSCPSKFNRMYGI